MSNSNIKTTYQTLSLDVASIAPPSLMNKVHKCVVFNSSIQFRIYKEKMKMLVLESSLKNAHITNLVNG